MECVHQHLNIMSKYTIRRFLNRKEVLILNSILIIPDVQSCVILRMIPNKTCISVAVFCLASSYCVLGVYEESCGCLVSVVNVITTFRKQ